MCGIDIAVVFPVETEKSGKGGALRSKCFYRADIALFTRIDVEITIYI